ncbi:MAG: hypothetical protein GKC08_06865 [Methanosarcinales archaeon]|nr:hypothetical protein [Methanosarcinales archaeon]
MMRTTLKDSSFLYEFELYNSGNEGVHITSVEPVLSENFLKIALTDENMVIVNKTIDSRSSILVSDQIEFNATGISKTEILKLEPFINGIRISSTETLSFP